MDYVNPGRYQMHGRVRLLIVAALVLAACGEPTTSPVTVSSSVVADSAARLSQLALSPAVEALVTSEGMVLDAPGGFTVQLTDRECASPTNTVSAIAAGDTTLLSTTMCQEPIDTIWSFPGPYVIGTAIILDFESGVEGATGAMQVEGDYPVWTVKFEDGYDSDFNDFLLEVVATVDTTDVKCSVVQRGQNVTCSIAAAVDSVAEWRWIGRLSLSNGDTIQEVSTDTAWAGKAVRSGTVEAFVYVGGQLDTLSTLLQVVPRPWEWGEPDWSWTEGGGPQCPGYDDPFYADSTVELAVNVRMASCEPGTIDPDVFITPDSGYVMDSVAAGPNAGLWYVASHSYHIDRGSYMNVNITSAATDTVVLQNGGEKSACRNNGIGSPYAVTFFDFNDVCKPVTLDSVYAGLWRHEGFGLPSLPDDSASGHERVRRLNAVAFDPLPEVEARVQSSSSTLASIVETFLQGTESSLTGDPDHVQVHSNFLCNTYEVWQWDAGPDRFFKIPLVDSIGRCF